ncbi:MAG: hypothetical protein ACSHX6_11500 [Akkermansiaceae bacterium]
MDLSDTNTTNHLLKPTWSRLLHRMHTLGTIQHRYHNAIASVSSQGEYPRLLTTPREDRSIAINGNHQWLFENWKQVTVQVAAEYHQANFRFTSESGELFHEISLTAKSQWDCFECMLKLFENESGTIETPPQHLTSQQDSPNALNKINNNITQVAKAVNREIIRGKKVICSLPLAGTSILKDLEFKSLMTQFGTAALKKQQSKLTLNPLAVSHHKIIQSPSKFFTTLFDVNNNPLLSIKSV